jgi:hypothetical protein
MRDFPVFIDLIYEADRYGIWLTYKCTGVSWKLPACCFGKLDCLFGNNATVNVFKSPLFRRRVIK